MIEAPHGHTSYGKCRRCGAVAEFSNTLISNFVKKGDLKADSEIKIDNLEASYPD